MSTVLTIMAVVWLITHPVPATGAVGNAGAGKRGGQRAETVDIAVVCDLLCVALQAGASLPRACEAVGAATGGGHGRSLVRVSKALELGASWEEAWAGHILGEILAPAWSEGVDPTPLLEQLARSIRANRAAAAKSAAARLSVRLVLPIGLCLLPAFILVGVVPLLVGGSLKILG